MSSLFPVFPPEMPLHEITITGVDPKLMIATDDHLRATVERFQEILQNQDHVGAGRRLQEQVVTMMHQLETTYTYVIARLGAREAAEEAIVYGRDTATVTLELPEQAATAGDRFLELLDEADDYCRAMGGLDDIISPPDVVTFRKWFIGEMTRKLRAVI